MNVCILIFLTNTYLYVAVNNKNIKYKVWVTLLMSVMSYMQILIN